MSERVIEIAKQAYRSVGLPLFGKLGGFHLLRRIQRDSALILMYHGVIDTRSNRGLLTNVNQVDTVSFAWQMRFLKDHYEIVDLSTIVKRIRRRESVSGLAAITFDDGYMNVFEYAAPILREHNLPATVFLIAGLVGKEELPWYDKVEAHLLNTSLSNITLGEVDYHLKGERETTIKAVKHRMKNVGLETQSRLVAEIVKKAGELVSQARDPYRLMGWPEIEQIRKQGFDIGVHSHLHPHLTKLPPQNLHFEIDAPAKLISDQLDVPIESLIFCYPDGDYNDLVRDRVMASGMLGAVAVKHDLTPPDSDPFSLPRVVVSRDQTPAMFREATVGLTAWLKKRIPI
jgi:peptidoglycan/xylan/chitin deacetylase (PgdA/CDA1 family)